MKVDKRRILELYDDGRGLSISAIRDVLGYSRNTIAKAIRTAKDHDLSMEKLAGMDDGQVSQLLSPPTKPTEYIQPDFEAIQKELDTYPDINLKLCWFEYHSACIQHRVTPYQYSRFCELYASWAKKTNATRRIVHRPGYAMQVDYAGSTGEVVDRVTGEIVKAYYFVATFPHSGKMYVEATPDMKMPSWIGSHARALRFFGGAPRIIVIDNLKTGVRKPDRYGSVISDAYADMARFYDIAIVPARVAYPKAKAQVERTVHIIQTWIIGYLRHQTFFSFADLNEAVAKRVLELNSQVVAGRETSRDELFEQSERMQLRPLPPYDFECAQWRRAKLAQDAHFQLEKQRYSAPYTLIGSELDVRITSTSIEAFRDGQSVCMHRRLTGRIGQYSTKEEHMPEHLRDSSRTWSKEGFVRWAERIGPATVRAIEAICDSRPVVEQAYRSCRGILALAKRKGSGIVERACAQALELSNSPSYTQIRNIAANLEETPMVQHGPEELCRGRLGDGGLIRDPDSYTLRRG
ncbi:MAG: IS21 family transposase [Coriobacteriales bacterium]|jgi:transposase|nr:IS21 family transposase [Coriobacteriales bacterium]